MTPTNLPEKAPNFVIFKTADGKADVKLVCRISRHTTIGKCEEQI